MRLGALLPEELWPEIWEAAVYIYNRSPRRYTHLQDTGRGRQGHVDDPDPAAQQLPPSQ